MKDSYYFPHDYNAHNDPKLVKLAMHGWDLVGLYWAIVEKLHEQGGWMSIDPKPIAFSLRAQCERIEVLLSTDAFVIKDGLFTTQRVLDNLEYRNKKSQSAKDSASVRWNGANAMRTQCVGNAKKGKERKGKEIKDIGVFDFESLWQSYPKRDGKQDALRHFHASVKTEEDYQNIKQALGNYLLSYAVKDGFIKNGSTWFNNWKDWIDFKEPVRKEQNNGKPKQFGTEQERADRRKAYEHIGSHSG